MASIDALLAENDLLDLECELPLFVCLEVSGGVDFGGEIGKILVGLLVGKEKTEVLLRNRELVGLLASDGSGAEDSVDALNLGDSQDGAALWLFAEDEDINLITELRWKAQVTARLRHGCVGGSNCNARYSMSGLVLEEDKFTYLFVETSMLSGAISSLLIWKA